MKRHDDDRTEWDNAWSAMPHRRMLKWRSDLRETVGHHFGEIVGVTINQVPDEYVEKIFMKDSVCLVCGLETEGIDRVAVAISPTFTRISKLGFGGWAHTSCFDRCPPVDAPSPIPW